MGIALWTTCAAAVFFAIRRIRFARPMRWIGELFTVVIGAFVLGGVATALDFGGWNEPDWRAGLFVLFGSAAVAGAIRYVRLAMTEP